MTTAGLHAPRSRDLLTSRSTAAASPNRAKVSQAGPSQPSATFDSGTVVPHRIPAATRAGKTRRRLLFMTSVKPLIARSSVECPSDEIIFGLMAVELDEIDLFLPIELQPHT